MPRSVSLFVLLLTLFSWSIIGYSVSTQDSPPEIEWSKTFGGSGWDEAWSVQETSDGGYIVTGWTGSYGAGMRDVWLIKTDSNGNKEWDRTFGGSQWDWGISVQQTADDGFIITGYTDSYGAVNNDIWLIKTDSHGNKEWDRIFGGSEADRGNSVRQTDDGGFIVGGVTHSYSAGKGDAWLIKTDPHGNKEWDKTLGGSVHEECEGVQKTSDGGFIITGENYSAGNNDVWLVKTDSHGNKEWDKTFGGSAFDQGYSVQQTSDGGFIVTGETHSYGAGNSDVWLIKTDSYGNKEWNRTFGGSDNEWGWSVQQTPDGGFIVTGETKSCGAGNSDVWLIKTDSHGNKEWDKTFGGPEDDGGRSIQLTSDGGFVITGGTYSYGAGDRDVWLIKTKGVSNNDDATKTTITTTEMSEIHDYDITVNSYDGGYKIGIKNNLLLSDLDVYFDGVRVGTIPMGPTWNEFEVEEVPNYVKVSVIDCDWHKDLSSYAPLAYNYNYGVIDQVIKDDAEGEIGLKIKIEYPSDLKVHEHGVLDIKVITKDFGYATTPDTQTNIQTFCILNVLSDESLRDETNYNGDYDTKGMYACPVTIGIVAWPLQPFNYWISYDILYQSIKETNPEFIVTDDLIEATEMIIGEVPINEEGTGAGVIGALFKAAELALVPITGIDFDEICYAFAKWQQGYTVGNAPSEDFFDENDHDCWTYVFGFNINENLCTGANGVWLNYPFSFDAGGHHEIKVHVDAMFEGDVPSLGIKGGRIGKEYQLKLNVADQA